MIPFHSKYEDEFAFFDAASKHAAVYETYKDLMRVIASEEVEKLVNAGCSITDRASLLAAAMEPYDKAFRKYLARDQAAPQPYPFSDYYRWWARQHATAFLHGMG